MLSRGFWIDLLTRGSTQLCRIMIRTYCWQARKRSPNNIVAQRANGNGTALTATTRPSSDSPEAGNHDGPNMSWVSGDSVRMTLIIGNLTRITTWLCHKPPRRARCERYTQQKHLQTHLSFHGITSIIEIRARAASLNTAQHHTCSKACLVHPSCERLALWNRCTRAGRARASARGAVQ